MKFRPIGLCAITAAVLSKLAVASPRIGTTGAHSTVGGGLMNEASANGATVGGGNANKATADLATVAGGLGNRASGHYATVGGGVTNKATGIGATVGGGNANEATEDLATVAGGLSNQASGYAATVGGGYNNVASKSEATVGGGYGNLASAIAATIGGGFSNVAAFGATVGGGENNKATGQYSTISGGNNNIASGVESFVAGDNGRANYTDSAVLAFDGGDKYNACVSEGEKTVTICASNGLFLNGVKLGVFTQQKKDAIEANTNKTGISDDQALAITEQEERIAELETSIVALESVVANLARVIDIHGLNNSSTPQNQDAAPDLTVILLVGISALLVGVLAAAVCSWYRMNHMQQRMKQPFDMQQPPPSNTNAPTTPPTTVVTVEMRDLESDAVPRIPPQPTGGGITEEVSSLASSEFW